MTRARELLVLSGGMTARSGGKSVLNWLEEVGEGAVGNVETSHLKIGACAIPHQVAHAPGRSWRRPTWSKTAGTHAVDVSAVAELWRQRADRCARVRDTVWQLTPTSLAGKESPPVRSSQDGLEKDVGRLAGIVAHKLLERWNFQEPPDTLLGRIEPVVGAFLAPEQLDIGPVLVESLRDLWTSFTTSELYERLRSAIILGREVPFLMNWEEGQVMEGVIDLIYRLDGRVWIADYKTDHIAAEEAQARARLYAPQARIYREAAARCVREPIGGFQFVFLRPVVTVDL